MNLIRTDSNNPDFICLVQLLDADLAVRDGNEHAFYSQYNKIDKIKQVVLAYDGPDPVGCGAIKPYDEHSMEVKRMFTKEGYRGRGIAGDVLKELEAWAAELTYQKCLLETGTRQPEAIHLYEKAGYLRIENYGQYAGVVNSVCFEKKLNV